MRDKLFYREILSAVAKQWRSIALWKEGVANKKFGCKQIYGWYFNILYRSRFSILFSTQHSVRYCCTHQCTSFDFFNAHKKGTKSDNPLFPNESIKFVISDKNSVLNEIGVAIVRKPQSDIITMRLINCFHMVRFN